MREPSPADDWDDAPFTGDPGAAVSVSRDPVSGRAALVPASVGRLTPPQLEAYGQLQRRVMAAEELRADIADAVRECRELGISWGALSWTLGITAEGARRRFSEDAP